MLDPGHRLVPALRGDADGNGVELPASERIETRTDTIYDLASVSKLFTSIVVMQQVEAGRVDLDAPVARYLPEFAEHSAASPYEKSGVTVRQLLTHTSGFPAFLPLWRDHPDPAVPPAGGDHRRPDGRGRDPLPLQRPEPDHARRAGHRG